MDQTLKITQPSTWQITDNEKNDFEAEIARNILKPNLGNLRREDRFCLIVENSTIESGANDYQKIEELTGKDFVPFFTEISKKLQKTESIGNPQLTKINNLSATTIRYIYQCCLMTKIFDFDAITYIVEIGGGYGGLINVLSKFNLPNDIIYYCYDLHYMNVLQQNFFWHAETKIDLWEKPPFAPDLVIANCSWSELDLDTRVDYILRVLSKAQRGFMMINYNYNENLSLLKKYMPGFEFTEHKDDIVTFKFVP